MAETTDNLPGQDARVGPLQESDLRLFALLGNLPGMAYRCRNDRDWTMVFVSEGCRELTGYAPADLINNSRISFGQIIIPDDREAVWSGVQAALAGHQKYQHSYRIRTASGETRWVWEQGLGIFGPEGELLCLEGFIMDITARKAAEAISEKYQLLSSQARDIILFVEPETGRILEANMAASLTYGYSREELLDRKIFDLRLPEDISLVRHQLAETTRAGLRFEAVHCCRDGRQLPVEVSSHAAELGGKKILVSVIRDIRQRKEAEQALRKSEQRMKSLLASISDLVFVLSNDLVFEEYYQPASGLLLIPPQPFVGKRLEQIGLPEPALSNILQALQQTVHTQLPAKTEYYMDISGSREWFDLHVSPFRAEAEKPSGVTCVVRNITERRRTEERLRLQSDLGLRLLAVDDFREGLHFCISTALHISAMEAGGLYLQDSSGGLKLVFQEGFSRDFINTTYSLGVDSPQVRWAQSQSGTPFHGRADTLGWSPGTLSGEETIRTVSLVPILKEGKLMVLMHLASHLEFEIPISLRHLLESVAHQTEVFIERMQAQSALRQAHIEMEDQVILRTVELRQEIAERKQMELELQNAKEAADSASRSKSSFLANMSHEIRTPLNAIIGFAQLMRRDPDLTPRQQQQLETINRSGEHLLRLITDVLDMSKIESGRMLLVPAECDFPALLKDMEAIFRVRTEEKGLQFEVSYAEGIPARIYADAGKIRQVLLNILGNALCFTTRGSIRMRVGAEMIPFPSGPARSSRLTIAVTDTGVGIREEDLSRVFEVFEQSENGRCLNSGTGLGLPISRQLARMMGGDVTVTSEVGTGSTFRITLTVALFDPELADAELAPLLEPALRQPAGRPYWAPPPDSERERPEPADGRRLSPALRTKIREAVETGYMFRLRQLLFEEVSREDPELARQMSEWVDNYNYEAILQALLPGEDSHE